MCYKLWISIHSFRLYVKKALIHLNNVLNKVMAFLNYFLSVIIVKQNLWQKLLIYFSKSNLHRIHECKLDIKAYN
jgi:hypothetical protein